MGVFRPTLDTGGGKAPDKRPKKGKGGKKGPRIEKKAEGCNAIETSSIAPDKEIEKLKALQRRAEKRLERARNRVDDIENELLLSDDPDDIDDLKAELSEAKARKNAAMAEWKVATQELDEARAEARERAKAKEEAEAEEMDFAPPKGKKGRKRPKGTVKVGMGDVLPEIDDILPPEEKEELGPEPLTDYSDLDDEAFEADILEDDLPMPSPRPKKKFKWTAKRAIAVGVIAFLILPVLLYGLVIPRVDITVKTWYSEGFQNSIIVDSKFKNDGTVEVRNMDLTITLMKEIDGVEVYLTELTFDDPTIYPLTEQKIDSIKVHDDQNANYVLLVELECNAGGKYVSKSYTHYIDKPYLSFFFEDKVFMWAL